MALLVLDSENATPIYRAANIVDLHSGEVVGQSTFVISAGTAMFSAAVIHLNVAAAHNVVIVERSGTSLNAEPLAPGELEFWFEKQAFGMIPKDRLTQYEGMFVASKDGNVVDSDANLEALTDRFFTKFGDVPVYMTRIGREPEVRVDTPFFE